MFVPFGGAENDWAALELGAWLALGRERRSGSSGRRADPSRGQRDASRLLADASLATQRVVGVAAEPVLADATEDALLAAVAPASVVVVGLPAAGAPRASARPAGARSHAGAPPSLLVHRGTRPGDLAPRESLHALLVVAGALTGRSEAEGRLDERAVGVELRVVPDLVDLDRRASAACSAAGRDASRTCPAGSEWLIWSGEGGRPVIICGAGVPCDHGQVIVAVVTHPQVDDEAREAADCDRLRSERCEARAAAEPPDDSASGVRAVPCPSAQRPFPVAIRVNTSM